MCILASILSCSFTPEMDVVYPRFANTYAVHYLFHPDSLFLEWEMRKSELVCFTVALWLESGNIWEGLWSSGCLQSGEANKHVTRSSHFLSTSYLPNAFREERERLCLSLKTNYPFFLEAQNVNGLEGESFYFLRICSTGAVHTFYYLILKAIPQQNLIFQMSKLDPELIDFLRTTLVVTGIDWD